MMKTTLTVIAGLALAASAQAGEDYSAKAPPAPAPAPCLWTWFAGGSVGYLDDAKDAMYTLHIGKEFKCPGSEKSHAIFLEIGYATDDFKASERNGSTQSTIITGDITIVPVTINYKYEDVLTGNLNWFVGAGAGVAFGEASVDTPSYISDEDERFFYGQIFGGLVYNVSESFEVFGGVRAIYMNDGSKWSAFEYDWIFDVGARYNF